MGDDGIFDGVFKEKKQIQKKEQNFQILK